MLNWIRTNVTVMLEQFDDCCYGQPHPRVFWGIGPTAAHLAVRGWGKRHLYIGIGDAS